MTVTVDAAFRTLVDRALEDADHDPRATMVAVAAAPAFTTLAPLVDPAELGEVRHVALRLHLHRDAPDDHALTVITEEAARGRLGTGPGVLLDSTVTDDAGRLAECQGWARLGPSAPLPEPAPVLAVPRAPRIHGAAALVGDRIGRDAVAAWLAHTGDEVPIHRDGHRVTDDLGGVAVPGALLAARILDRTGHLLADGGSVVEMRFKRLVPTDVDLAYRVVVDDAGDARVAIEHDGAVAAAGSVRHSVATDGAEAVVTAGPTVDDADGGGGGGN